MKWTLREISGSFADNTSIHGIGRIHNTKYIAHKIFWLVVFFASLGMLIFQVYRLGLQYVSHQVNTKITIFHGDQLFPSVTFCNLNVLKFSEVLDNEEMYQVLETLIDQTGMHTNDFNFPKDAPTYTYHEALDLGDDPIGNGRSVYKSIIANLDDRTFEKMSLSFDELVFSCKFNGKLCFESNFTRHRSDDYGFCYEMHTNNSKTEVAGTSFGLELILNVHQSQYVPFMTESAGVKVIIENPKYYPDLVHGGFDIPTGFEVNIGVTSSYTRRFEGTDGQRCDVNNEYPSIMDCIKHCLSKAITTLCGCAFNFEYTVGGIAMCAELEDWRCIAAARSELDPDKLCPNCKQPCEELSYHPSVSMTKWPSKNYEPVLKHVMSRDGLNFAAIRDDLLIFRVYFSHLASQKITEERAYTEENFVSDIGGQLGLWCGLSVLSCIEVFEFVCMLVISCVMPRNKTADNNEKREFRHGKTDLRLQSICSNEELS